MPELPEVETIARRLREVLVDQRLQHIDVLSARSWIGDAESLQGRKIVSVDRRAKYLRISFEGDLAVAFHLKMTGQLIYTEGNNRVGGGHPSLDWVRELPSSHTRVMWQLDRGKLFFNDQRLFGWGRLVSPSEWREMTAYLGPDAHENEFSSEVFAQRLAGKTGLIKALILDQSIAAGVGNIYACDALWEARISPLRRAHTLTSQEVERLHAAIQHVLQQGIEHNGTTFDGKYVTAEGLAGTYSSVARVYGREGEACRRCGALIVKQPIAGRGTYWCPGCQI
jgi:formamidopyrimidine-DNA glycosylase